MRILLYTRALRTQILQKREAAYDQSKRKSLMHILLPTYALHTQIRQKHEAAAAQGAPLSKNARVLAEAVPPRHRAVSPLLTCLLSLYP